MIDTLKLKVGVLEHPVGGAARFNPRHLDFTAHHGFHPVVCKVKKANEKWRVPYRTAHIPQVVGGSF
jgi:hypothetical protein